MFQDFVGSFLEVRTRHHRELNSYSSSPVYVGFDYEPNLSTSKLSFFHTQQQALRVQQ